MRSPDLVRFFMRAVVLLIFFLLGWFFVASWFAMPVGWLAGKMAGLFFPWASAGVDIQGVKVDLLTQLRVPDPAGFVEGRMAMASPEVDYRLFGYGLPLFVALLLASDAQRFGTVENQRTDVAGFKLVGTNDFFLCLDDCRLVEGHLHLEDFCRIEQALGMFVQAENGRAFFRLVSPDTLENAHAVMQGVGEDMSGGFAPRNEFSVLPDEAVTVCHGHRISPFATDCEVMILAPGRGEGRETVSPFPLHP